MHQSYTNGEQHVDSRESRISRDKKDVNKILKFFESHYPFPNVSSIMSIATGVIGGPEVNCYDAEELGTESMQDFFINHLQN